MAPEVCDVCGSSDIKEVKCKLICQNCGTILKTCADLAAVTPSFKETRHGS
jgi:transcription initiation factor TFIIIB Brf1 subunit/transcription initiation factor TFIIB